MGLKENTAALAHGYAIALCEECLHAGVPEGTIIDNEFTGLDDMWYECDGCGKDILRGLPGFTAHPAGGQRCPRCRQRKPREDFKPFNWATLDKHGICEECRLRWIGGGPGSRSRLHREGLTVEGTNGRVLGRIEGTPPPASDPYAESNKEQYWRIIYSPEPLPGQTAEPPTVLEECTGMNLGGCILALRTWHGQPDEDQAFTWAADYEDRWERLHPDRPLPAVEMFTRGDVVKRYGSGCYYCKGPLFQHLDHYVPLSAGGAHTLENVRPSCASCNLSKGRRIPVDATPSLQGQQTPSVQRLNRDS